MSIKRIVATAGSVVCVVGISAIAVLFYAEKRAVSQLDEALKQAPSGMAITYENAHYSLLSGLWTIEGVQVSKGATRMRMGELTVQDLDRGALRAAFSAKEADPGRALARQVTISGWSLEDAERKVSVSYAVVPFPYFRTSLPEDRLFELWGWFDFLETPNVQILGVSWKINADGLLSKGYLDRLHMTKVARVQRSEKDGKFVWTPAEGRGGRTAVEEAHFSALSFSWSKEEKISDADNASNDTEFDSEGGPPSRKIVGAVTVDRVSLKEGFPSSLLTHGAKGVGGEGAEVFFQWLKGLEGQRIEIASLSYEENLTASSYLSYEENETSTLAVRTQQLSVDGTDGTGKIGRVEADNLQTSVKTSVGLSWYADESPARDISVKKLYAEDVVLGDRGAFPVQRVGKALFEDAALLEDKKKQLGVRSFALNKVTYDDGVPLMLDVTLKGGEIAEDAQAVWFFGGPQLRGLDPDSGLQSRAPLVVDGAFVYAYDPKQETATIDPLLLSIPSVGALTASSVLKIGPSDNSFADPDFANERFEFLRESWKEQLSNNVSIQKLDLRYTDDGLLGGRSKEGDDDMKMSTVLRDTLRSYFAVLLETIRRDLAGESKDFLNPLLSFADMPEGKALSLHVRPNPAISIPSLFSLLEYMPFSEIQQALQARFELVPIERNK